MDQENGKAKSGPTVTRRAFGLGGGAVIVGGAVFAANWFNITANAAGDGKMTVQEVHAAAKSGQVFLIDIRRPDEWKGTGVGASAHPIDMRRDDFTEVLLELTKGDKNASVALICARGVRSRGLTARLTKAGFKNIIDVPEGMLGSGAGPGWLKSDLPTVAY